MPGHHHRSGSLRQSNKRNKRSKASKRSVSRLAGGKVEGRVGFKQRLVSHSKADRRHIQQQKREAKRLEILRRKRGLDGGPNPPRIVGIVGLGEDVSIEERLRSLFVRQADSISNSFSDSNNSVVNAKFDVHKKEGGLTILTNASSFQSHYSKENDDDAAVLGALDLCRVCDIVLFVIDGNASKSDESVVGISIGGDDASTSTKRTNATSFQEFDHLITERGDRILAGVKAQGLPKVLTVLAHTQRDKEESGEDYMTTQSAKSIRRGNMKRKADLKKYVSRFARTEFGIENEKIVEVDLSEEKSNGDAMEEGDPSYAASSHVKKALGAALVRTVCTTSASASKWVSKLPRAYVLSDSHHYHPDKQVLEITGYVRGIVPFDVNALIHVPNLGTFACKSVKKASHPFARKKVENANSSENICELLSDPTKRESLEMFATPNALDGEQNLIGFDEEDEALTESAEDEDNQNNFARPAGWSDYQSAWLDAVDEASIDEGGMDHGELAKELNKKRSGSSAAPSDAMDLDDANQVTEEERQALFEQRRKEQHEHKDFPDEVEVKEEEKARDRFARYRSLKSFRKSYWDPKENLPDSYATIYNFASFKATQRSVMSEMKDLSQAARKCDGQFWDGELKGNDDAEDVTMSNGSDDENDDMLQGCIPSGSYVTLTLEGVSHPVYSGISEDAPIVAVALLPHENKISVLHMGLSHTSNCDLSSDVPVKSKDVLTFRCGWRTWTGRAIFSQNNLNCDKHKFERFLPQVGSFFAASVFGPVTYTPCPVLVLRDHNGRKELVAVGSMLGADADRIVVKRIVLTGYPVKVRKRFATVKYMFYDPDDVKWFKPAGLTTKLGLHGNIEESVGEHGTMKCLFNAPIKQHDTVCMPLFKRVYPKLAPEDSGGVSQKEKNVLIVR